MKSHRSIIIAPLASIVIFLPGFLYAQDVCEAFAKYGIYDTRTTSTDTDKASSFRSWFCQSNFESQASADAASINLSYESFKLGAGSDSKSWAESYSNYCSDASYNTTLQQKTLYFVKTINTTASDNMLKCFTRGGLHVRIIPGAGNNIFYFQAQMNPTGPSNEATVESIKVIGATCDGPIKNNYKITAAGAEQICKRSGENAVDISLTTNERVNWDSPRGLDKLVTPLPPPTPQTISIQAKNFVRGTNVAIDQCTTGPGMLANKPPCQPAANAAEFEFYASATGKYQLDINFAAAASRPTKVILNGKTVVDQGLSEVTGGWDNGHLQWYKIAEVILKIGPNTIRLERDDVFPHIHDLRLNPIQ